MTNEQILVFLENSLKESVGYEGDGEYTLPKFVINGDKLVGQIRTLIAVLEAVK